MFLVESPDTPAEAGVLQALGMAMTSFEPAFGGKALKRGWVGRIELRSKFVGESATGGSASGRFFPSGAESRLINCPANGG